MFFYLSYVYFILFCSTINSSVNMFSSIYKADTKNMKVHCYMVQSYQIYLFKPI